MSRLWVMRAFCRGANPEIFDGDVRHDDTAKAYCQRCPVVAECLDWALSMPDSETIGVWGGTNEEDRRKLRRNGARYACPGCGELEIFSDGVNQICISCALSWRL